MAKIVSDRISKADIRAWAAEFNLPNVESVLSDLTNKITSAMAEDFACFLVRMNVEPLFRIDDETPGRLLFYVGGLETDLPHGKEVQVTLRDVADEVCGNDIQFMTSWRDDFKKAADYLTREIEKAKKQE